MAKDNPTKWYILSDEVFTHSERDKKRKVTFWPTWYLFINIYFIAFILKQKKKKKKKRNQYRINKGIRISLLVGFYYTQGLRWAYSTHREKIHPRLFIPSYFPSPPESSAKWIFSLQKKKKETTSSLKKEKKKKLSTKANTATSCSFFSSREAFIHRAATSLLGTVPLNRGT